MIKLVTQSDLMQAAMVHSESWKESHRNICSAAFIESHTPERQKNYLASEIAKGAQLYMLIDRKPVGIVSVYGNLIENLYVLPSEQNKGYGTQLLTFAVGKCTGAPVLWVLSTNDRARRFYERNGFRQTGNIVQHAGGVSELEFSLNRE